MTMFTQRENRILDQARDIISRYYQRGVQLCSPDDVRRCVMVELAPLEHEEFGIILLDNQNQLLHREILFRGTLNSVSVHPAKLSSVCWNITPPQPSLSTTTPAASLNPAVVISS